MHICRFFIVSILLCCSHGAFYYPSPQIALLEHILVDNWGAYASNFSSAITPCTNYVTQTGEDSLNSGRTSAAQWMRVSFHDFVTANITAGTGGIDASIGFETFREENKGSAFNDSFTFWRPFVNEHVSMSDLVALGTVMSVNLCGGNYIPFRPGRVDATQADSTTGVPEPGTDLESTLALFSRAGFNTADSISLTACGHTMGSVHHGGFPEVSPASAVTPNNTNGGVNFDTTRGAFDPLVVQEYLDGTGQMGGPLVTSFNLTSRSDLRLYESDGNATMMSLRRLEGGFQDTCVSVIGRMINTVPHGVSLANPIYPIDIKPVNLTWDFNPTGDLVLKGKIRFLSEAALPSTNITVTFSNYYTLDLQPEPLEGISVFKSIVDVGNRVYGTSRYYSLEVPGAVISDVSNFRVSTPSMEDHTFSISSGSFIVPSQTRVDNLRMTIMVATPTAQPATDLSVVINYPVTQPLTLAPRLQSGSAIQLFEIEGKAGYLLRHYDFTLAGAPTGAITLTLVQDGLIEDSFILDTGVAGW